MSAERLDARTLEVPRLSEVKPDCGFLQVLVTRLELHRRGDGVCFRISVRDDAPAVTGRRDRTSVARRLDFDEGRILCAEIDSFRASPERTRVLEGRRFGWRHASGGVIARVSSNEATRVLLFHRDIHPVGWNIANGASGSVNDLLDIEDVLRREAAEELLFAADREILALADRGTYPDLDAAVALWAQERQAPTFRRIEGVSWRDGPDTLEVEGPDGHVTRAEGLFIGAHAEDFGLECVRGLDITLPEAAVPLDGELSGDGLLDRPVGLFTEDSWRAGAPTPESLFRGGIATDGIEASWCPVTRGLVGRV